MLESASLTRRICGWDLGKRPLFGSLSFVPCVWDNSPAIMNCEWAANFSCASQTKTLVGRSGRWFIWYEVCMVRAKGLVRHPWLFQTFHPKNWRSSLVTISALAAKHGLWDLLFCLRPLCLCSAGCFEAGCPPLVLNWEELGRQQWGQSQCKTQSKSHKTQHKTRSNDLWCLGREH